MYIRSLKPIEQNHHPIFRNKEATKSCFKGPNGTLGACKQASEPDPLPETYNGMSGVFMAFCYFSPVRFNEKNISNRPAFRVSWDRKKEKNTSRNHHKISTVCSRRPTPDPPLKKKISWILLTSTVRNCKYETCECQVPIFLLLEPRPNLQAEVATKKCQVPQQILILESILRNGDTGEKATSCAAKRFKDAKMPGLELDKEKWSILSNPRFNPFPKIFTNSLHYMACVMEVLYSWSSMPPNHDFSNKNTAKKKFTQGTSDFSKTKHRPRGPPKARLPGWILVLEKTNETERGPNFIAKQKRKYDKILGCPRKLVNV